MGHQFKREKMFLGALPCIVVQIISSSARLLLCLKLFVTCIYITPRFPAYQLCLSTIPHPSSRNYLDTCKEKRNNSFHPCHFATSITNLVFTATVRLPLAFLESPVGRIRAQCGVWPRCPVVPPRAIPKIPLTWQ